MNDQPHPDPERLWKHRRRLVYGSWTVLAALILVVLIVPEHVAPAEGIVQSAMYVLGLHIMAYYGTAVAEAFAGRGKR